jgi:hypothetical protein
LTFNFTTDELDDVIDVVLEPVLKFLVVGTALVGGSFPQGLGETIEDCRFPPRNLIFEVLLIVPQELKVDLVLL